MGMTEVLMLSQCFVEILNIPPVLEGIIYRDCYIPCKYIMIRATTHWWHYKYVFDRESIVHNVSNFGTQTFSEKIFHFRTFILSTTFHWSYFCVNVFVFMCSVRVHNGWKWDMSNVSLQGLSTIIMKFWNLSLLEM